MLIKSQEIAAKRIDGIGLFGTKLDKAIFVAPARNVFNYFEIQRAAVSVTVYKVPHQFI